MRKAREERGNYEAEIVEREWVWVETKAKEEA